MARPRRRVVVPAALVLGLGLVVLQAPRAVEMALERRLEDFFGRPVTIGRVELSVLPFTAEIHDLRVGALRRGDPPFLEVPRAVAIASLRALVDRRVELYEVRVQRPVVRVHAFARGGDDLPRFGGESGSGIALRRLLVEGGELWVDHQRVPLDLDLPKLALRLRHEGAAGLQGRLLFGPGRARFGAAPPLDLEGALDVGLVAGRLQVTNGRVRGPRMDLAFRGQVHLRPRPAAELAVSGPMDLALLDRHVLRTDLRLAGAGRFQGTARFEGPRLRFAGRLEGTDGSFDGVPVQRFAGQVSWDEHGVKLRDFRAEFMDGAGTFDVDVEPSPGRASVRVSLERVDAESLAGYVFDLGPAGLGAWASGRVDVQWPRGAARLVGGRGEVTLVPRENGRTPLGGAVRWTADRGVQTVEDAAFDVPFATARARGRILPDRRADLEVEASTEDIARADQLAARLRAAAGNPAAEPLGAQGRGRFTGRWTGTLADPTWVGRFSGEGIRYLDVPWGRADWALTADARHVSSHTLVLARDGAEMRVTGTLGLGDPGGDDAVDARVSFRGWPADDLARALAWELPLVGAVSGEAVVTGRRTAPFGTARVAAPSGAWAGVPFRDLRVRVELQGDSVEVREGRVTMAGGDVTFRGSLSDDGLYDGQADLVDLDLALLPGPAKPFALAGRARGSITVSGPWRRPTLAARLESPAVSARGEALGAVAVDLAAEGDGRVHLTARAASGPAETIASGWASLEAPHVADLALRLGAQRIDRLLGGGGTHEVPVTATGTIELRGPLARPADLVGRATLAALDLAVPEHPMHAKEPVELALTAGRLEVRRLHLGGEGTDLHARGASGIERNSALDLEIDGTAELALLSLLADDLRGRGAARVLARVTGATGAPVVEGTLAVEGGGLRVRGFPHGLDEVAGTVRFTGEAAQFSGVTGTIGGGRIELAGQVAHRGGRLRSFDVQGTGQSLVLRYPEGLRSVIDADLRLFGDAGRQWLTGTVNVKDAVFTRRYDVASELLDTRVAVPQTEAPLGSTLRYDVRVLAPGTLKIDNNLATLAARADLALQGTYSDPVVVGRAEVDRGRLYFQGNTYVIRRGRIDFTNPQQIDPVFDLEAETRVRAYAVNLRVTGTLRRVHPVLTSDPPLSTVAILNLLAGAEDPTLPVDEREHLAATGAATLAAGRIAEEFGLERQASRLGLSRFSIDPTVARGEYRNPTVRLTAGRRVTPDLSVVYSQDLRGTQEHLLSVEYTLSDRVSLLLTRAEPGGVGFDLRLRRTQP